LEFSKKKSLDARCVMYGVSNRFPDSVASELRSEIVRVAKAFGDELEDNSGSVDSNEDSTKPVEAAPAAAVEQADDGEEVEVPAPKAGKKGAKATTETKTETKTVTAKGAKGAKSAPKQVDVEEEEPAAAEEPAEEPAEEVKPKKPAPATKAAPAKSGAKATKGK